MPDMKTYKNQYLPTVFCVPVVAKGIKCFVTTEQADDEELMRSLMQNGPALIARSK